MGWGGGGGEEAGISPGYYEHDTKQKENEIKRTPWLFSFLPTNKLQVPGNFKS